MQKEKTSRKTLTQNVNIPTDAVTDEQTGGRTDEKKKTIYPSTYFVCRAYNE